MTKQRKVNAKPNKISTAAACAFLALVLLFAAVGGVYAKYVWGVTNKNAVVSTPNFYFTSDLLAETAKSYTLNPGKEGTTSFTFEVRNYADTLRVSNMEIEYTVAVEPNTDITIINNPDSGKLTSVQKSATVTVSGLKNGQTYTITATGKAGFVSTLSATVAVEPDAQNIYKNIYEDSEDPNYVLLTVWTENVFGNVRITFPAGLIPDNTDAALCGTFMPDNETTPTKYTFEDGQNFAASYSSHIYRFFKAADAKYDVGQFIVMIGEKPAVPGVPK